MSEPTMLQMAVEGENEVLAKSVIANLKPVIGPDALLHNLQQYAIIKGDTITDAQRDLTLDLMQPLFQDSHTLEDAGYIAPNLSPEVADLLLFMSGELVEETLESGSSSWYMIPTLTWRRLLELSKAAIDRHAQ